MRTLEFGYFYFHLAEAVDEVGAHPLDIARYMHPHPPFVHFFQQHAKLELRQRGLRELLETLDAGE